MDKVEPERLQRSIPLFKPWISGSAWDHWKDFLESALPKLATVSSDMNFWPLLTIKAASDHGRLERNAVNREDENVEGAQLLEEMLDEERIAVEVHIMATYCFVWYYIILCDQILLGS